MSPSRFLLALVFAAAPVAFADAVYTYTGAPFNLEMGDPLYLANPVFKLGQNIDLIFDFSAPLAPGLVNQTVTPVSWSYKLGTAGFVPGGGSITLQNSIFSTDSTGSIDNWFISALDSPRGFSTSGILGDAAYQFAAHDFAGTAFTTTVGTWTAAVGVPEPRSLPYIIVLLLALFSLKCRVRAEQR